MVSWQGEGRLLKNVKTREANKQDRRPKKRLVRQAEDMLGKSKHFKLNTVELPREIEPEMLSPPSHDDALNQVKVANELPTGQKCTYMVMTGCESRASVPKMHPNCTYMVRLECESRDSVPKLHHN